MISDDPSIIDNIFQQLKRSAQQKIAHNIQFRKKQLANLIQGINEMTQQFDQASKLDLGYDPFTNFMLSTGNCLGQIKFVYKNFENWAKRRSCDTTILVGPGSSYLMPEPLGVTLVIGSWNYPLFTSLCPLATAIAAGNCVILKPSEMTPNSSNMIRILFEKYLDPSCYRVIEGGVQVAKAITTYPFELIIFTGSPEKGKCVARAAAENLTKCILELGGKSPAIVDEDANIENAGLRLVQGKWTNCGQTCVAPDYIFVNEKVSDKFLKQMQKCLADFYGNDPKTSIDYPRLVNQNYTKRIQSLLQDDHKGQVLYGGEVDIEQRYVQPTIVVNPAYNSKMMREEIFGPVLPILKYQNIDEVINYVNSQPKPLSLYYYGSKNKEKINQNTSSGAYCVNESIFHVLHMYLPFGGVSNSGNGQWNGKYGFDQCSHLKPVLDKLPINSFPLSCRYPPYSDTKKKYFKNNVQNY